MRTTTTIASYPAYDIVAREPSVHGAVAIEADEPLAIFFDKGYEGRYALAYPSSVVSYALRSGADPIEWLHRAEERGEELHWINREATVLTSQKQERKTFTGLYVGQWVKFEGRYFCIQRAPNDNFKLVSIDPQ